MRFKSVMIAAAGAGILASPASASSLAAAAPGGTASDTVATRWVGVSVATLWSAPGASRPVDLPALSAPADPRAWLSGMTLAQRKGLNGRVESQAVYGTPVQVLGSSGVWSQVAVPGQPSPKQAAGYPGWVPTAQLTDQAPQVTPQWAIVTVRAASLTGDAPNPTSQLRVSYGTRLPVLQSGGASIAVAALDGRTLYARPADVALVPAGASATGGSTAPTGAALVAEARKFLGLPYLWGGTSGFGFDCSGLTHAVYAQLGLTIPRDAGPQFATGRRVTRAGLRAGDLVFFRNSSGIHHVGMYVGNGRMIHSPRTGTPVQISSLRAQPWAREFAGGRRYLN